MGSFILILMFIIVFCCYLFALQHSPLSTFKYPLAFCTAALGIIGLQQNFSRSEIEVLLIPYEALALTLLTLILLWLLSKFFSKNSTPKHKRKKPKKHKSWDKPGGHRKKKRAEHETSEMKRKGETISQKEVEAFIPTLKKTRTEKGNVIEKSLAELRCEAKRKLTNKRAAKLAPRYSLYALRHSWATNALQKGVDSLTVAILMGHEDPSTLSKVYQHLSLNPQHMLDQAKKAAG